MLNTERSRTMIQTNEQLNAIKDVVPVCVQCAQKHEYAYKF